MNKSTLPLYTVDSFSAKPFAGNPAAVCLDNTKEVTPFFHTYPWKMKTGRNLPEFARSNFLMQDQIFI